jgi:hypothetical protein
MTVTTHPPAVPQLLAQIEADVPEHAAVGRRATRSTRVTLPGATHQVTVNAHIDEKGRRRLQYLCDGVRVERSVLLRLTCPEQECPQARAVRGQWADWHRGGPARERVSPPTSAPLMQEQPLRVGRHHCTARPARFACFTPCPHEAHPPMTLDKTGYDLFEDGQYLGGGLVHVDGVARPRLPTLRAAEAHVLARHLEALVLVDTLEQRLRGGGAP